MVCGGRVSGDARCARACVSAELHESGPLNSLDGWDLGSHETPRWLYARPSNSSAIRQPANGCCSPIVEKPEVCEQGQPLITNSVDKYSRSELKGKLFAY